MSLLVQQNTVGALGWLCCYSRVLHEPLGSCGGTAEQYRRALGRLCWYSRVLLEHPVGCVGRAQYYRSTREAVLVQQSTK